MLFRSKNVFYNVHKRPFTAIAILARSKCCATFRWGELGKSDFHPAKLEKLEKFGDTWSRDAPFVSHNPNDHLPLEAARREEVMLGEARRIATYCITTAAAITGSMRGGKREEYHVEEAKEEAEEAGRRLRPRY